MVLNVSGRYYLQSREATVRVEAWQYDSWTYSASCRWLVMWSAVIVGVAGVVASVSGVAALFVWTSCCAACCNVVSNCLIR